MRRKHGEKEREEPWIEWEWMRFPSTVKVPENLEVEAERQTDGDLMKSIPQLVCDFHVEAEKAKGRHLSEETRAFLDAQKRMVAMMGQVAMNDEKVSEQILALTDRIAWLTRWLLRLTVFIVILTLAMVVIPLLIKN